MKRFTKVVEGEVREKRRVTCVEVAKLAGVTIGSVSRVLNHASNVSPDIRDRVNRAVAHLNYRPSAAGRMLATKQCETIGLLSEVDMQPSFYTQTLIQGISEALSEVGKRMAMGTCPMRIQAPDIRELSMLKNHSVDGLIVDLLYAQGDLHGSLSPLGLPCVYVNTPDQPRHNAIIPDDRALARSATEYLIARGHRKIAYLPWIGGWSHPCVDERMAGYAETMARAGYSLMPGWDVPAEGRAVQDLMPRIDAWRRQHGVTAILCFNGAMAADLFRCCYHAGIRVPNDLSLMACDDDLGLEYLPVGISCYRLNRREMGQKAVQMVMQLIGETGLQLPSWKAPGTLVERESVKTLGAGE